MRRFLLAALVACTFAGVAQAQTSSLNSALSQSTSSAASSLSVAGQHTLVGFTVAAPTPSGAPAFVMAFDAASVPADGVVTPGGCYPMTSPSFTGQWTSTSMANTPFAAPVVSGVTLAYSVGADCWHLVKSAVAFITVLYQ